MREKALHLKNVSKKYGGRTVVNVDDMVIGTHGIEGLIGPNGAGKTTLISLITHKVTPDTGTILYYPGGREVDITRKSVDAIARMGLVRTNQLIQDFEHLSIRESMLLALADPKSEKFYKIFGDDKFRAKVMDKIDEYLDYFHFDFPDGHALSAGEKKLLDIIRCMLLEPKFLLMDEPTAGIPHDQTNKVIELMRKKTANGDMSILIVEHDLDLIWSVSENVFFMSEGEIMLQGTPDEVRKNEVVIKKYMGESNA